MEVSNVKNKVVELDLNDIMPNRFQPRIKFNEDSIKELSISIAEHGVIQPIVVRPLGNKYEIIAGERRYKASLMAGKTKIPAIIMDLNDKESAEIALIENVQRKDLTPIEEAISYKKILDMGNLTQDQLADKLGKKQSTVANKLRLLNLSDEVQEALLEDKISERHARSLLKLQKENLQNDLLNRIINERLTVRLTDQEIAKILNNDSDKSNSKLNYGINDIMDISDGNLKKGEEKMNNDFTNIPKAPIIDDFLKNDSFVDVDNNNLDNIFNKDTNSIIDINNHENLLNKENSNVQEPINSGNKFFNMFNLEKNENFIDDLEKNSANMNFENNMSDINNINLDVNMAIQNDKTNDLKELSIENEKDSITSELLDFGFLSNNQSSKYTGIENDLSSFSNQSIEAAKQNENSNIYIEPDFSSISEPIKHENKYVAGDLKTAINTMRECVATIEKYGFKVDSEELDLENYYQVTIKIEK